MRFAFVGYRDPCYEKKLVFDSFKNKYKFVNTNKNLLEV